MSEQDSVLLLRRIEQAIYGLEKRIANWNATASSTQPSEPITMRYYEQRVPNAEPTVYDEVVIGEPFQAYPFDLSRWERKLVQLHMRFLLGKGSELESGSVRIVGEVEP